VGTPVLELQRIRKVFKIQKDEFVALDNINFSLQEGEWIGLVGESGSGKSTLARVITQISAHSNGDIFYMGKNTTKMCKVEKRNFSKNIQIVFQNPLSTFSQRMKIGKYLIEALVNYKIQDKKAATERAKILLEKVGLSADFMDRYPHQLSGGELQRIVITRAMTVEPSVIIFDEATSDLDVTTQRQILELLIGLKKKTNFAAIFVSHDIALVQKLADRIYVMLDGKVVESFKKENLRSDNRKEYTKLLTNAGFSIEETKISLINDDYVRSGVNVETKSKQKKKR